jgi:hypothetical protein
VPGDAVARLRLPVVVALRRGWLEQGGLGLRRADASLCQLAVLLVLPDLYFLNLYLLQLPWSMPFSCSTETHGQQCP